MKMLLTWSIPHVRISPGLALHVRGWHQPYHAVRPQPALSTERVLVGDAIPLRGNAADCPDVVPRQLSTLWLMGGQPGAVLLSGHIKKRASREQLRPHVHSNPFTWRDWPRLTSGCSCPSERQRDGARRHRRPAQAAPCAQRPAVSECLTRIQRASLGPSAAITGQVRKASPKRATVQLGTNGGPVAPPLPLCDTI